MDKVEELMRMLPAERPKVRLRPKLRGRYMRRPRFSHDHLVAFMKAHNVRSVSQLNASRGRRDPIPWDFRREFGSWSKAIETVWGVPIPELFTVKRPDHRYLVKCCLDLNITTRDGWLAARRMYPAVIPSIRWVRLLWGRWDNLLWQAEKESFRYTVEGYVRLQRQFGRAPTNDELRREGIQMDASHLVFEGKHDMDKILRSLPRRAFTYVINRGANSMLLPNYTPWGKEEKLVVQSIPTSKQS